MQMPGLLLRGALLAAFSIGSVACVVHDTPPVNPGYGYGMSTQGHASANVTVGQPSPYYVESSPPEPLYEQMSDSPGDGSVWIDGYWHWNGYEWVWITGRWEREQVGYVYVEPSYAWTDEQTQYVYTPGYWAQPDRVPHGWHLRDHRDGRPTRVAPPAAPPGTYGRPPVAGGYRPRPPTNGTTGGPVYYPPPRPRPTGGYPSYPSGGGGPIVTGGGGPIVTGGGGAINTGGGGAINAGGMTPAPMPAPMPGPAPVPSSPEPTPSTGYRPAPMPVQPHPNPGYHPPSRDVIWHGPTRVENNPAPQPQPSAPIYVNPTPPAPAPAPTPSAPPPAWHPAPTPPPAPRPTPGRPVERPAPSSRRDK